MSESATFTFELNPRTRRKLYLDRIRANAQRYYNRYRQLYDQMIRDGYDQYLPEEFDRVQADLDLIGQNLKTNPETASDVTTRLGGYITQLPLLAREARKEFEIRERQRQKQLEEQRRQAKSEIETFLHEQIVSFSDPIVRDYAYEQIRSLQKEYSDKAIKPEFVEKEKETLRRQLQTIRAEAESKAVEWKRQKKEQTQIEAQRSAVEIHCEAIAQDENENPRAVQDVLNNINSIQQRLKEGTTLGQEELQDQLQAAISEVNESVMNEQCRKETVKAIVNSLRKTGFVVDTPRRRKDGESDEVIVKARKPAGNQAEVRVTIDGGFLYKFDRYEGMSCKKDIDKILPMLQDIYGIKLSGKRVLWQNNPDRILGSARPLDMDTEAQQNG